MANKQTLQDVFYSSRLNVLSYQWNAMLMLEFVGSVSKFPSVSNNRLTFIQKQGMNKIISALESEVRNPMGYSGIANLVAQLKEALRSLRARSITNPEFQVILDAATSLWQKGKPANFQTFHSEIDTRLFGVLLCGSELRQHDTHNITKSMCDWLQQNEIIKNDRHLDVIALRTEDFIPNCKSTFFCLTRQNLVKTKVDSLLAEFFQRRADKHPEQPIQRSLL